MRLDWKFLLAFGAVAAAASQIGTGLKGAAWIIGAPEAAYAARSENAAQQLLLERLTTIQEQNQQMLDQRQAPFYDTDAHGVTWACDTDPGDCWVRNTWRRVTE